MRNSVNKVLVVQGETDDLQDVVEILENFDFTVKMVNSKSSLTKFDEFNADLIILQYSISDMSGILFCKNIIENQAYALVPILFISNSKLHEHQLHAFELGSVGFMTRPVCEIELIHRAKSCIEGRKFLQEDGCILIRNLFLNPNIKKVLINDKEVLLTAMEFKLLHFLLACKKQIIPKEEIYRHLWGNDECKTGRLETQLYNLKKKIYCFNGVIKSVSKIGLRIFAENPTFDQAPKKAGQVLSSEEPRQQIRQH